MKMGSVLSQGWLLFFFQERKKELRAEFKRVALPQLSRLYTSAFYLTKDRAEAWLLSIMRNLFINRYKQKKTPYPIGSGLSSMNYR